MNRHLLFIGLFVAMLAIDPAIQGQSTPSCGPLPFPEAILPEGTDVKTSADLIAACSQKYGKDWSEHLNSPELQDDLRKIAESPLVFPRLWPDGDLDGALERELFWCAPLRQTAKASAAFAKAYALRGQMDQADYSEDILRILRNQFTINAKFRKNPGSAIEFIIALSMDQLTLDTLMELNCQGVITEKDCNDLRNAFRPSREDYAKSLEFVANSEVFFSASILSMIKDDAGVQRLLGIDGSNEFNDFIAASLVDIIQIRKKPEVFLEAVRQLARHFVDAFRNQMPYDVDAEISVTGLDNDDWQTLLHSDLFFFPKIEISLLKRIDETWKRYDAPSQQEKAAP